MRKVETQTRTETKEVEVAASCDLCGFVVEKSQYGDNVEWSTERYAAEETAVFFKTGWNYPEMGDIEKFFVDICPTCFNEKLIPWLEEQGVTIQKKELSY